jgi:hypothetical protein
MNTQEQNLTWIRMSAPRKKLTRKRLNNALVQVHRNYPGFFLTPPTKMTFFEHVHAGHLDDVQEFLEEPDFNINMRDEDGGSTGLFYAMDGAGGLPMVKLLLENGADINAMNNIGQVPLHVLCRDLTSLSLKQIEILEFMFDQENLILFPFAGRSIESVFLHAMDDLESFDQYMFNARVYGEERTPEEEERYRRQTDIQVPLSNLYEAIQFISEEHVKYVNVVPANTRDRTYYHLDTRMTGEQLKQMIQRQVYQNPFMNLDLLFAGRLLDTTRTLDEQGVNEETTITYQVRLASGVMRRLGGKRKTRRRRN